MISLPTQKTKDVVIIGKQIVLALISSVCHAVVKRGDSPILSCERLGLLKMTQLIMKTTDKPVYLWNGQTDVFEHSVTLLLSCDGLFHSIVDDVKF